MPIVMILVSIFFLCSDTIAAKVSRLDGIEKQLLELQTQSAVQEKSLKSVESFQEKVLIERQGHQQFVENMFSTFVNYVLGFLTVCGIAFGLITYLFGNNCKEHFNEKFEESVGNAKREALQKIDQFSSQIEKYSSIIELERKYLSQRISVIEIDKTKNLIGQEIDLLRKAGFSVKLVAPGNHPLDFFMNDVTDTDVLVIVATAQDDLLRVFENINSKINLSSKKIPLVIYVKERNETLNKLLDQYPLALSANMPMTLVNSIYTVSKIKSLLRG